MRAIGNDEGSDSCNGCGHAETIGNPQRASDAADWVTVEDAARLTGESVRTWRRIAVRACGESRGRKGPPPAGKGKPIWYVHRSIDARLTRYPARNTREDRVRTAPCAKYPHHHVAMAYRKGYWLQRWRTLCETNRDARVTEEHLAERIVQDARLVEAEGFKVSYRTLRNWQSAYNAIGANGKIQGVEGLIHGCAGSDRTDGAGGRSPDAIDYFCELYHTESKQSAAVCHETTLQEAKRRGWTWPTACERRNAARSASNDGSR